MKCALRSRFPNLFPGVTWEYFIIENPFGKVRPIVIDDVENRPAKANYGAWEVTRQEARKYIEEHGLVEKHQTKDGIIWDEPGESKFREAFKLTSKTRVKALEDKWD